MPGIHPALSGGEKKKPIRSAELKKVLGIAFGVAVLVGGTIGSGILRTPGTIAQLLNNYWLIIGCWLFGGLYALLGAGPYAELATMLPKAGGAYNYVKRAFGNYAGFLTGWYDYITNGIGPAYFSILIGEYLALLAPSLHGFEKSIAIAFLSGFTLLHFTGVKTGSITQQITSLIKVICFVALIIGCFVYGHIQIGNGSTSSLDAIFTGTLLLGISQSLQMVFGTYNGWNVTCFFAEEDRNPGRNIPRSLFTGIIVVIIIYVLVNMAFLNVLPISTLSKSTLAASDAARVIFGENGATIVTIIALFSLISILNAYMMIPARILFGMSRDGFFIRQGVYVNSKGTPVTALIFSALLNFILVIIGSFTTLFALQAFTGVIVFISVYISCIKLRIKEPHLNRPYRAWGYPYTIIAVILLSIGLLVAFAMGDPVNFIVIGIITLVSYPAFILITKKNHFKQEETKP